MNYKVRNIFGVAAAVVVLLGLNFTTDSFNTGRANETDRAEITLPDYDTDVKSSEEKPVSTLKDLNDEIVNIAEKTNPAVVTITTEKTEEVRMVNPFSQFFGMPRGEEGNSREYVRRGLGSGVIISEEGYILTNNHVIENVDQIKVRLFNGDEVSAELIGADPATDIAVLQVNVNNIPTVKIGNSEALKVGSFVLAIGSPLSADLAHTVSFGIVSAKGRSLNNLTTYGSYIQTDAAINPGNSGGALIDMNGELVGINSAIASRSGGNDGIGFAIPIDMAKRIMDDLIEDGEVSRGYLGMYMAGEVDQTMARALGLEDARGIIVGEVEEDGPADQAGLQQNDVIVSVNDEQVRNWSHFRTRIASFMPGEEIQLGINRDGNQQNITVTLGKREDESTTSVNSKTTQDLSEKLGFTIENITAEVRGQLRLENNVEGVIVNNIQRSSNAYNRGLRQYDIITAVSRQNISSPKEFYEQLEEVSDAGDEVVLLTVNRQGIDQYIAFEL